MRGSEPPYRFKCRKAKFQDVSVGSKLPLDNLTPTVEDRENYGTFIKQPEIIAGQRDRRGQTPRQPAHFFARFDQNVEAGEEGRRPPRGFAPRSEGHTAELPAP